MAAATVEGEHEIRFHLRTLSEADMMAEDIAERDAVYLVKYLQYTDYLLVLALSILAEDTSEHLILVTLNYVVEHSRTKGNKEEYDLPPIAELLFLLLRWFPIIYLHFYYCLLQIWLGKPILVPTVQDLLTIYPVVDESVPTL